MTDPRQQRAEDLFQRALDLEPDQRAAFLDAECGDDAALRDEVDGLLGYAGDDATGFLDKPAVPMAPPGRRLTDPDTVGPYRVLGRLGDGAYGVVYEVEQTEPIQRRLALKLLKAGMDTEEILARFETERQTLAVLDHPNIARVIDAGASDGGRPYFVMELVRGETITDYCDSMKLDLRARLELFIEVGRAVQHAHQRGVLHRDLKPSNILVSHVDGRAMPKVIDFGIAKVTTAAASSRPSYTLDGQAMGTPIYMSPEQSGRSRLDVDTATDVYSMGVLLYELLCGQLPYDAEVFRDVSPDRFEARMRENDPAPPSIRVQKLGDQAAAVARRRSNEAWHLRSELDGDLDWIVMRAIERDRLRRYQTLQELIQEIERYFRDDPVLAGPPGIRYRLRKFVSRNRGALMVAGLAMISVLIAAGGLTYSLIESNRQRMVAESARAESDAVLVFLSNMLSSADPGREGADVTVVEVLDAASQDVGIDFAEQPQVEARLRSVMGLVYRELGRYDDAHAHFERGLQLIDGREDIGVDLQRELGTLQRSEGDYASAESTFVRILDARRQDPSPDPRLLIQSLTDLGGLYVMAERHDEGIPILEEAQQLARRENLPDTDPVVAVIYTDLGNAYRSAGMFDEAEVLLLAAIDLADRSHGHAHAGIISDIQNLAGLYRETGRLDEALPLYRRCYVDGIEVFGGEHPVTLRFRSNYALCLSDMGLYEEALVHSQEVVTSREALLGLDNPSTLASRLNLALLYARMDRYEESAASARETRQRIRTKMGEDHIYAMIVDHILGSALHLGGDPTAGEVYLRAAVTGMREILPADSWRLGRTTSAWGACVRDLGRHEDAERLLTDGHRILDEALGPDDKRTRDAAGELARLYELWQQPDAAAHWRELAAR